jgi:multidrug resistance protein MdtO
MATSTLVSPPMVSSSWMRKLYQDLQPTPGRLNGALKIVLASIITLVALMVLQMPFASLGLYYVFLVGRDSPSISLRTSIVSLLTLVASIAVELILVIVTDNDPMARVLGVAGVTFIAGMLMFASNVSALASTWGFIFCTVIAFWETPAPADALVKISLFLIATVSIAIAASVAVEYVFGSRRPVEMLDEQIRMRYQALETMFGLYAQGAAAEKLAESSLRVARLAATGQAGMQALYNQIVDRNLDSSDLAIGSRVRITMLAQLMDVSAAFGYNHAAADDPEDRRRCARIAEYCHELMTHSLKSYETFGSPENGTGLLDRVEDALGVILSMPLKGGSPGEEKLTTLSAKSVPLLIPGGLRNKDTVAFALKLSLCATLCYIFYHAVDWPGISTSVTTVIITGLSTSGAIKQKMIFRLLGSAIGGLILGLGCTTFVFPYMDSITSLVILIAVVAFISAWWAGGRLFNYVGLQIAFSFYLVAFEGFSAPTQLAPARDRLIGILLALVVMYVVFDQLWPVRTVTAMRRSLASVLHSEASFLRLFESSGDRDGLLRRVDGLRDQIGKTMAGIRTMNEAVEYEFGVDRAEHAHAAQVIIRAGLTAVALFWNQLAVLHRKEDGDFITEPGLVEMRRKLAGQLDAMADAVCDRKPFPAATAASLVDPSLLESPRYAEYTQNAVGQYGELQNIICGLSVLV